MRQRALGRTGLLVSELGLGTWGLAGEAYGALPEGESAKVLERARAMGLNLFETASNYAGGRLEGELGELLRGDKEAVVVTKWGSDESQKPPRKCFERDFLRKSAEESLARLGEGPRLVALLHNPSLRALRDGAAVEVLSGLVQTGRLAAWGVSVSDADVAGAALEAGASLISLPYNILQVQPLRALRERLEAAECGVLAHSILAYGLLAGRWAPSKEFPPGDHRAERWPDGALRTRLRHLDAVRPLVSGEITTLRGAALCFALAAPAVSSVIIGPKSTAQLDQLVRDTRIEPPFLSEQKLSGLEGRLSHLGVPR